MDSSDSIAYDTYVENGGEGVTGRLFKFCITWNDLPVSELWTTCKTCQSFLAFCCGHSEKHSTAKPCHHYKLCFTDGACLNNGRFGSRAGIGGALGESEEDQWAIPVDDNVDPDGKRSSQRAELLAAIEGLRRLSEATYDHGVTPRPHPGQEDNPDECWIIATDSEYVCNGITQWIYTWQVREPSSPVNNDFKYAPYLIQENNWLTRSGTKPSNLDLFFRLHHDILSYERDQNIRIGFWKVDRTDNQIADGLAKKAANLARQV